MKNWKRILTENDIQKLEKGNILLKTDHVLENIIEERESYEFYVISNIISDGGLITEVILNLINYSQIDDFMPIGKIETYIENKKIINGLWWVYQK